MSKLGDWIGWSSIFLYVCIWLCLGGMGFFIGVSVSRQVGIFTPEPPAFTYGQSVRVVGGFYVGRTGKVAAYLQHPSRYLVTEITPAINLEREWIREEYLEPVHAAEK